MPVISYKEFMEEVKGRLATLSHEDLLNLIISWADKAPSSYEAMNDYGYLASQKIQGQISPTLRIQKRTCGIHAGIPFFQCNVKEVNHKIHMEYLRSIRYLW